LPFAIPYSTYSTPGFAHSYDGVGRDWKGNIYIGNGNGHTDATGNAAVFKFNFTAGALEKVFDCQAVSQAAGNWLPDDKPGKIHSSIKQGSDGKLYFTTHSALETGSDAAAYPQQFRGGHFYRYDPESGAGEDLSDPNTVSRKIFDDNFGHVYIPWFPNYLMEYDPVRDTLTMHDLSGHLVQSWIWRDGPYREIPWLGKDKNGKAAPSGLYILRLRAGGRQASARFLKTD
jgi:hypothetical protein